MVGVREVARAAGVSTATVVRVVKGEANVAPATRRAVESVIEQLGYVPNAAASALASGRSRMVGLLVPSIQNPYNSSVAEALQVELLAHGYSLLVSSMLGTDDPRTYLSQIARAGTLAGIAMTSVRPDAALLHLISNGLASVFIDQRPGIDGVDVIRTNNREITVEAIMSLLRLGHHRIAMIGGPPDFDTARERLTGYRDAHHAFGIEPESHLERVGNMDERGGYDAIEELLQQPLPPTAIFAYNGRVAVGVLEAVRARGLRIPEDLSLISFDDEPVFEVTAPPVTAIHQPTADIGRLAAQRLVAQLGHGTHTPQEIVLPSRIIERQSVTRPTGHATTG